MNIFSYFDKCSAANGEKSFGMENNWMFAYVQHNCFNLCGWKKQFRSIFQRFFFLILEMSLKKVANNYLCQGRFIFEVNFDFVQIKHNPLNLEINYDVLDQCV